MTTNSILANNTNYIAQNKAKGSDILKNIAALREDSIENSANAIISNAFNSQIQTIGQEIQNGNDAIGMLKIAESSLASLGEGAVKLEELSIKNSNGTLSQTDKAELQKEFASITKSMETTIQSSSYNGKNLFSSELSFLSVNDESFVANLSNIKDSLNIENQDSIKDYAKTLENLSSEISGSINKIESSMLNSLSSINSATQSSSSINDTDIAKEIQNFQSTQIKLDATLFAKAHNEDSLRKNLNTLLG